MSKVSYIRRFLSRRGLGSRSNVLGIKGLIVVGIDNKLLTILPTEMRLCKVIRNLERRLKWIS